MSISPLQFLALMIGLTALARLAFIIIRQRHRRAIHALARKWEMHYSADDRFQLAARVAARFPIPGAAELRIVDLIYGREGDAYRYLFTAEYTIGVIHGKHRHRRAVTFCENRGSDSREGVWSPILLAEPSNDIVEQYVALAARHDAIASPSSEHRPTDPATEPVSRL